MQAYEYRVVSAPRRGAKARGLRTAEDRFAHAVEHEMNRLAAEGWDYVRSDTLPSEERPHWFSSKATVLRTVLVFRRATWAAGADHEPLATPLAALPVAAPAAPAMTASAERHPAPPTPPAPPYVERPAAPPLAAPVAAPAPPALLPTSRFPPPPRSASPVPPAVPSPSLRRPALQPIPQPHPPPAPPPGGPIGSAPGAPTAARPSPRLPLEDLLSITEPGRRAPPAPEQDRS